MVGPGGGVCVFLLDWAFVYPCATCHTHMCACAYVCRRTRRRSCSVSVCPRTMLSTSNTHSTFSSMPFVLQPLANERQSVILRVPPPPHSHVQCSIFSRSRDLPPANVMLSTVKGDHLPLEMHAQCRTFISTSVCAFCMQLPFLAMHFRDHFRCGSLVARLGYPQSPAGIRLPSDV